MRPTHLATATSGGSSRSAEKAWVEQTIALTSASMITTSGSVTQFKDAFVVTTNELPAQNSDKDECNC